MSDDDQSQSKSWLTRLSAAISREPQDKDDLLEILKEAKQREVIDADSFAMIEGVLEVSNLRVRDIMVPRSQMTVIDQEAPLAEILPIIMEYAHSRYPVIGENRDEVVGILLAKDLLPYHFNLTEKPLTLKEILRPAFFVPESKRLDVLLREFRLNHNHMAIVADEYGGTAGLITIEDVLEEIVGDIEDEYDTDEDPDIKDIGGNANLVKSLTPIEDFNEYFQTDFSDEEFDTIGGLIMSRFGYLPKRGESIELNHLHFKVVQADSRRIRWLRVKRGNG